MNISLEQKKAECIARMKMLQLHPGVIRQFDGEGQICISNPPFGVMTRSTGEDLERIRQFEQEHNAMVYFVVRTDYSIGTLDSYLFVNDEEGDWVSDRRDIKSYDRLGVMAYVCNRSDPELSESGYIGVERTVFGGLCRTW